MKKKPFVTLEKLQEITAKYPTPFHLYDEKGIRDNAKALKEAFAWNKGFKEFFAVKATPNPYLIKILQEYGCGCDCSSMTELMLSKAIGCKAGDIMFSSNDTPEKELKYAIWMILPTLKVWSVQLAVFQRPSAAVTTQVVYLRSAMILWTTRVMQSME